MSNPEIPNSFLESTASKQLHLLFALPSPTSTLAMDSFTTISLFADNAPSTIKVPTDQEGNNGQGSGTYCVIFAKDVNADLPHDAEGNNGQGSGTYCTIA